MTEHDNAPEVVEIFTRFIQRFEKSAGSAAAFGDLLVDSLVDAVPDFSVSNRNGLNRLRKVENRESPVDEFLWELEEIAEKLKVTTAIISYLRARSEVIANETATPW